MTQLTASKHPQLILICCHSVYVYTKSFKDVMNGFACRVGNTVPTRSWEPTVYHWSSFKDTEQTHQLDHQLRSALLSSCPVGTNSIKTVCSGHLFAPFFWLTVLTETRSAQLLQAKSKLLSCSKLTMLLLWWPYTSGFKEMKPDLTKWGPWEHKGCGSLGS